jgi:hypothetical protein
LGQKTPFLVKKTVKNAISDPKNTNFGPKNAPPDEEKIDSPLMNLENGRICGRH